MITGAITDYLAATYRLEDIDGWKVGAVVPASDGQSWWYEGMVTKQAVEVLGWFAIAYIFDMVQAHLVKTAPPFDVRRIEWRVLPWIIFREDEVE